MPRRTSQHFWAAAIFAALICVAFGDVVFLGRTLLASNFQAGTMADGAYGYTGRQAGCQKLLSFHGPWLCKEWPVIDSFAPALQWEPYVKLLHNDVAHHWLPLWDPYVGAGAPLLANMAPAMLSPLRLMLASIDKPAFWDFYILLRLFVAAFFTYLLAREVGIGFAGSLVAGVCFSLSGHFIYYVNMPDLDTQIWVPALLLVTKKLAEKPTYRAFAITTAVVALIILGGMPESAFFVFLLATLFLLFCLWQLAPEKGHEKQWWRRPLAAFAGAGAAGLLISLPQILPFAEYVPNALNPRAPGVGMNHTSVSTLPSLIMQSFFGHLYSTWNDLDVFAILPYVGSVCCLLALAGICRKWRQNPLALFFAGFVLFYLLKAFGIPPVQWVGRLPLFSMSLFPKHAFPEFMLCMAMLAGIGADHILQGEVDYARFLLASLLLVLTVVGFVEYYWIQAEAARHLQDVISSWLLFDLAFALVWLAAMAARRFPRSSVVAVVVVLLPAAELIASVPHTRAERYDAFTKPPFVEFLKRDPQPYRTFSVDNILFPNTNAAYGIQDIRTLDPLQVHRYIDFLRAHFSPFIWDRFDTSEVTRQILGSPMLDLMNVKYILGDRELPVSAISGRFELIYDHEIRIYRNTKVLPRAFIATSAEVIRSRNTILARMAEPDFDPRRNVILEENMPNGSPSAPAENSPVTFDRYEPNYIRLHAEPTHPGWLVLTDTYYPGWKVRIDGKPGRIVPADYTFRGVALEPGAHVVEFVYRPASFVWGVGISILTLGILGFVPLWSRWKRRAKQKTAEARLQVADEEAVESLA